MTTNMLSLMYEYFVEIMYQCMHTNTIQMWIYEAEFCVIWNMYNIFLM